MNNKLLTILIFIFSMNLVHAAQNITVYGGGSSKTKLAISGVTDPDIIQEISFDLTLSGDISIEKLDDIEKIIKNNAPYNLKLKITDEDDHKILSYILQQNFTNKILLRRSMAFHNNTQRKVIHTMDNAVYQAIVHSPAAFNSKIAIIVKNSDQYHLIVSDYDGDNAATILKTKTPISSLAWSRDNSQLAYVFYGANKPVVYTQNITTGVRTLVAAFDGSNSSPVFIGNNKLLVTLSKDEVSHLYAIDNNAYTVNKTAVPIMVFGEIDTEADISSDGRIVFTSDYEGEPQIFITDENMKSPMKLTDMIGKHLTTARFSQDGSKIVLVKKEHGFRTFYYDLKSKSISCISEGQSDLAPSFAPDNKMVLYSSNDTLYISSTVHNKISAIGLQNTPYDEVIDQRWSN